MKVAVMQPYFFPYIGYFQLINAVDKFIFYDDVNFIKKGWINRNRILVNNNDSYITVNLNKASQNRLINDITIANDLSTLIKTIEMAYKKAPYFNDVMPLIINIVGGKHEKIADLAIDSVVSVSNFLNLEVEFERSSLVYHESRGLDKADRLIEISNQCQAHTYINPIGGQELYTKEYFRKSNLDLKFIRPLELNYKQFGPDFHPWLSIIDVLMFNSKEEVVSMLKMYELV